MTQAIKLVTDATNVKLELEQETVINYEGISRASINVQ
jgi:hypothetical protein